MGELVHRALAGSVGQILGAALKAAHRGDVDDLAPALFQHHPAHVFAAQEQRLEVDVDHLLPGCGVKLCAGLKLYDALAVHQDVDAAVGVEHVSDHALYLGLIGDVGGKGRASAAQAGDRLCRLYEPGRSPTHHADVGASGSQGHGHGLSQATGSSDHQGGPIVEPEAVQGGRSEFDQFVQV